MSTMIERVARAICLAELPTDNKWELCVPAARAAIEAMREPTDEMTSAMIWQVNDWQNERGTDQDVWYAPIDAALKEDSN
ncbi:hypothetical protein CWR43_28280 [Rhizobium sullae]|uniref:Uncharacterized protein n=1 Tax=Rhizobium sullae TaxID=50338 RepID=A0A2N0D2W9_RHISU|nr:hypothetical protein [Rhizobium sullae]PKA40473.1 hypothetical protein CWR43_28280 [Rhizobium sullae]